MKLFLFLFTSALLFQVSNISTVRKNYQSANSSESAAEKFIQSVAAYNGKEPTMLAYQAAAKMLEAKHEKKLGLKKQLFIQGAQQLEEIISKNPTLVEARMIRISIQENTPKLMKYKENIKDDKKLVLSLYRQQTAEVQATLLAFIQQSASFTEAEKRMLK